MTDATLSILVVDDDHIVRFLHRKIIESFKSFNIIYNEAINGQMALQILHDIQARNEQMPAFILLDINMPVLDGFGFIEAFQKLNVDKSKTQIIIVTSSENSKDKRHCYDLGITKFILKPLTVNLLESEIKAHFIT